MTIHFPATFNSRKPNTLFPSNMLILSGISLGIFIFLNGFLLNRSELAITSSKLPALSYDYSHQRLILIIVDAFSYDFTKSNSSYYPHINETFMPFVSSLHSNPQAFIAQFIADPPTTTLQRLKALTTGSMPTFIDAGSNFGSTKLMEDNLLVQWKNNGRVLLFVGDDTWIHLYPEIFSESHPYPSFNVKDLDTVDNAVKQYVLDTLTNTDDSTDWSILVGHMLGVDHCGHTFGPNHPEMYRKLREVDTFIKEIVDLMQKDDLLVVLGDHGMTISGDHGGDSAAEVEAALIVYSKHGFPMNSKSEKRMNQIDLVPSLAILTGIPIPYSNLGVICLELFNSQEIGRRGLIANFVQLINYTLEYSDRFSKISFPSTLNSLIYSLPEITSESLLALADHLTNKQLLTELHLLQLEFRNHWTRFDLKFMILGGLLILTSLLLAFTCYLGFYLIGRFTFYMNSIIFLLSTVMLGFPELIYLLPVFCLFMMGFYRTVSTIGINTYRNDFCCSYVFLIVLLSFIYLSNSFLINEFRISIFIIQSLLILRFIIAYRLNFNTFLHSWKLYYFMGLTAILRFSLFLETCREESFINSSCRLPLDPLFVKSLTKLTSDELFQMAFIRIVSAGFLLSAYLIGIYFTMVKLEGLNRFMFKRAVYQVFGLSTIVLFICCWLLDAGQSVEGKILFERFSSTQLHIVRIWLARIILLSLGLSLLTLLIHPFWFINVPKKNQFPTSNKPIPFSQLINISLCWTIPFCLTIPSLFTLVFSNEWAILCFAGIALSIWKYTYLESSVEHNSKCDKTKEKSESLYFHLRQSCSWTTAVLVCLLDLISFYATGHQPTIAGIPWEAAFTAYSGDHGTQWIPAFMVSMNIFAGPIVTASSLPLFILAPLYFARSEFENLSPNKVKKSFIICLLAMDCLFWRFFLLKCILMFGCALSAGVLRRHLMVWKIFAPRLIFMVANVLVTGVVILFNHFSISYIFKPKLLNLIVEFSQNLYEFKGVHTNV